MSGRTQSTFGNQGEGCGRLLEWNAQNKCNAIKGLKRVSRPGLRKYASVAEMPRVLNGLGIAILSTSKGIMTDAKARKENVGGEVLCYVF